MRAGGPVRVLGGLPEDTPEAPAAPTVQGHEVLGGPQMIQLRWAPAAESPGMAYFWAWVCIGSMRSRARWETWCLPSRSSFHLQGCCEASPC